MMITVASGQTGHIFANVVLALAAIPSAAAGPNPPAAAPDLPRTSVVLNLPAADLRMLQ